MAERWGIGSGDAVLMENLGWRQWNLEPTGEGCDVLEFSCLVAVRRRIATHHQNGWRFEMTPVVLYDDDTADQVREERRAAESADVDAGRAVEGDRAVECDPVDAGELGEVGRQAELFTV